jgi:hypothetical protein
MVVVASIGDSERSTGGVTKASHSITSSVTEIESNFPVHSIHLHCIQVSVSTTTILADMDLQPLASQQIKRVKDMEERCEFLHEMSCRK